jgi:hypothetical protein
MTQNLMYIVFWRRMIFLPYLHVRAQEAQRACARCIRSHVLQKSAWLIIESNLFWPLLVLPRAIAILGLSFVPGHTYQFEFEEDYAFRDGESAWRSELASASCLLWLFPVIGIAVTWFSYNANKRHTPDGMCTSATTFVLSLLAHLGFATWTACMLWKR